MKWRREGKNIIGHTSINALLELERWLSAPGRISPTLAELLSIALPFLDPIIAKPCRPRLYKRRFSSLNRRFFVVKYFFQRSSATKLESLYLFYRFSACEFLLIRAVDPCGCQNKQQNHKPVTLSQLFDTFTWKTLKQKFPPRGCKFLCSSITEESLMFVDVYLLMLHIKHIHVGDQEKVWKINWIMSK